MTERVIWTAVTDFASRLLLREALWKGAGLKPPNTDAFHNLGHHNQRQIDLVKRRWANTVTHPRESRRFGAPRSGSLCICNTENTIIAANHKRSLVRLSRSSTTNKDHTDWHVGLRISIARRRQNALTDKTLGGAIPWDITTIKTSSKPWNSITSMSDSKTV